MKSVLIIYILSSIVHVSVSTPADIAALKTDVQQLQQTARYMQFELDRAIDSFNESWLVITAILTLLIHIGLGLNETGGYRTASTHIIFKYFGIISLSIVCYWIVGFCVSFGYQTAGKNGFIGNGAFVLVSDGPFPGAEGTHKSRYSYGWWFYEWVLCSLVSLIISGSIAERASLAAYGFYTVFVSGWVYPIIAHWVWSCNGWLSSRYFQYDLLCPEEYHLGRNGMIDHAGSGVVHLVAGWSAFVAAWMVGPRAQRGSFSEPTGNSNILYRCLGALFMWIGQFAFVAGSTYGIHQGHTIGKSVANTAIASAFAVLSASCLGRYFDKRWRILNASNGIICGVVAISAGCGVVEPWAACIIGTLAGLFYWLGSRLALTLEVDDVTNAWALHGICGLWGVISVGFFATQKELYASYGRDRRAFGFLFFGGLEQLGVQFIGALVIIGWTVVNMYCLFWCLRRFNVLVDQDEGSQKKEDDSQVVQNVSRLPPKSYSDSPLIREEHPPAGHQYGQQPQGSGSVPGVKNQVTFSL